MADVRKSATHTAARTRAREKAAEFRERHDKLEQLAVEYFVAAASLEEIAETTQNEIAAAHKRAAKQSADARSKTAAVIASMLNLGAPRVEVADRLGIALREVKKVPATSVEVAREPATETASAPAT